MKDPRSKKAIAAGLSLTLALGSLPAVAFADNAGEGNDGVAAQQGARVMYNLIANGGEFADGEIMTSIEANEGEWVDFPTPTRAGYSFTGWYSQSDMSQIPADKQMGFEFKPTAPQAGNWFAAWEKNATQSIKVVSHFVGGDRDGFSETTVVEVPAGSYVSDCVEGEVEGYTAETIVSGVATSAVEVYMTSSLEGVTTLNVYYKANEQKDQNEANVTFFANGGKFVDGNEYMVGVTASDGTMPQPPAPTREGYTFAGWYWHADYSNYTDEQKEADKVDFSKPVEKGGSMFAQWTKNEAAKTKVEVVSFFQGGDRDGSNVIANVEVTPDSSVADCVQAFDGYHATKVVSGVATSEVEVNMTSSLEGITTLYVYYEANKVEEQKEIPVTYVANGGQFADGQEVQQGLTDSEGFMRQPAAPTREGYTFAGWYWVSSLDGLTDEQKDLNKVDFTQPVTKEHVMMFAQWVKNAEQNEINVLYVANGGQFADGNDTMMGMTDSKGFMRQPAAPTREGYTFAGWYWHQDLSQYTDEQKEADKVDFTKSVAGMDHATMYAQWVKNAEQNEIDVMYVANGGQFATGETFQQGMTDADGFMRQPAAPTREGYTFAGWYWVSSLDGLTDEQKDLNKVDFEQSVAGKDHVTMFAQWTKDAEQENLFNVMYVANGGQFFTGEDVQQGVTDSEGVMRQPAAPTREGYTFDGWYWHADLSGYTDEAKKADKVDFSKPLDRDAVMYAQWVKNAEQNEIDVMYVANGGQFATGETFQQGMTDSEGFMRQPAAPTREGYTFAGWYWVSSLDGLTDEQKALSKVDFEQSVAGKDHVTMFAQWTKDAEQENLFNVMYVANGGQFFTGEDVQQGVTDSEGVMRQPAAPTREGYTFDGWYWHSDYTNYTEEQKALDKVDFTAPIDRDAVMYAQWSKVVTPAEKKITVKFVDNFNKTESTVEINEGEAVAKPKDPSYEGWSFEGWSSTLTDEQGNAKFTPVDFSKVVADEDEDGVVTYYAFYTEDKAETPADTEKKDEPKLETTEEDAPAAEEPAAEAEAAAIPQTGDATNAAAVAGVAGIAGLLAAAAALIRRRFNN